MNKREILRRIKNEILKEKKLDDIKNLVLCFKDINQDGLLEIIAKFQVKDKTQEMYFKHLNREWVHYTPDELKLYPAYIHAIGGNRWGYINDKGKFMIKPSFMNGDAFSNEMAIVEENNLYGVIDTTGTYTIKPVYDKISPFYKNRAVVKLDNQYFLIDEDGNKINDKVYEFIGNFSEDRVVAKDKAYGYLDLDGNEVIPFIYKDADDFKDCIAVVKNEQYQLINFEGETLETYPYKYVGDYGDNFLVYQEEDLYGYIDEEGTIIIPAIYQAAKAFQENHAIVSQTNEGIYLYGVINRSGKIVIPVTYNEIVNLGYERFAVGVAEDILKPYLGIKYALFDATGKQLTEFIYQDVKPYQYHLASANTKRKTYFIDLYGKEIKNLPVARGEGTLTLLDQLIKAEIDRELYYLDYNGELINYPNYIIPINSSVDVTINKYKPNPNYLVYYPQIESLTYDKALNERLKELSQVKSVPSQILYTYYGNFTVLNVFNQLLQIKLYGYKYTYGAAHGVPYRKYVHLNLKTGKLFTLSDLFNASCDYRDILSLWIRNHKDENKGLTIDETFQLKDDPLFYIEPEHMVIVFEPYEVAPYSEGFVEFKIPFQDLSLCIDTNKAFWQAFNR